VHRGKLKARSKGVFGLIAYYAVNKNYEIIR
jgi:hypothetical protein